VRRASLSDVAAWARLRTDFIRQSPPPFAWDEAEMEGTIATWLSERLDADHFAACIGLVDGQPAGIGAVTLYEVPPGPRVSGTEAYISSMYTDPAFRGRGVAKAVLASLVDFARESGVRGRVWLRTTEAGAPLYQSAGFIARDYYMQLRLSD
jgi:GNAT superfamily N-acetyltransferase